MRQGTAAIAILYYPAKTGDDKDDTMTTPASPPGWLDDLESVAWCWRGTARDHPPAEPLVAATRSFLFGIAQCLEHPRADIVALRQVIEDALYGAD
jgi:hypothetical protein